QSADDLRIEQVVAHAQQEGTVQIGLGLEYRNTVRALPLIIDDMHDLDSLPSRKCVQRSPYVLSPIAAHHKKTVHPRGAGTGNHALEQSHSLDGYQRLAWTLLPQPPAHTGGDDEAVHGPTARSFAVLARMKASTMSYASSSVYCFRGCLQKYALGPSSGPLSP